MACQMFNPYLNLMPWSVLMAKNLFQREGINLPKFTFSNWANLSTILMVVITMNTGLGIFDDYNATVE